MRTVLYTCGPRHTAVGFLCTGAACASAVYAVYLLLYRETFYQTYNTLPLLCFQTLVLPVLWISAAYLLFWLLHRLSVFRLPVCKRPVRLLLLLGSLLAAGLYEAAALCFVCGLLPPSPFLNGLFRHTYLFSLSGAGLYFGIKEKPEAA